MTIAVIIDFDKTEWGMETNKDIWMKMESKFCFNGMRRKQLKRKNLKKKGKSIKKEDRNITSQVLVLVFGINMNLK